MTNIQRRLIVGNWKLNGLTADLAEIEKVAQKIGELSADIAICPPATLLQAAVRTTAGSRLLFGAQDCSAQEAGAYTGDISARMIADCRARFVILGHSERRQYHGEMDAIVKRKAEIALSTGLTPVICVGETESEHLRQETVAVLKKQLQGCLPAEIKEPGLVIAYEPVWSIGTGRVPDQSEILSAHSCIRTSLIGAYGSIGAQLRILYGGSVKPENSAEILSLENVDGVLVGGASLRAESFLQICAATAS
ncbi:triose-phosphate isomerase [Agrobacterium rhizogenes]|uniref:triose-phosphate isomerase n=1 Tax=Rhizobium rhizogenes TaxID=359 RepID=UPI001574D267|nr:triose-phosphate isomerase [Rhizobium rhizogenes]NTF72738.1 triose-phosphate isomerase [Rhizobium rhizogenes]NTF91553.1 triose-phosphate isomerase [Rhizobium rhizogenes]